MAAGLWLYEQANPDMGSASAGRVALGSDASTASTNPWIFYIVAEPACEIVD